MKLLLDTHLLLWLVSEPHKLSSEAMTLIETPENAVSFSIASLWEIAIKNASGRADFAINLRRLRRNLIENDYRELPIESEHVLALSDLPVIHKDPFDRILLAQATAEAMTLLTSDAVLARYPGPVRQV
ncbi:twitching motility protein PilT [Bosea sp. Root381]|uniref:type II toxin-antitoxin system VapC family toxin n=1 Tax=Bosea sp. Root381 TaxID=1736524 RepID=UPI0006FC961E|nr:type II toxin-antitoxin system VapC family toxin [Bosea sp. Root381]KRE06544.1 twitching motility protein PilT [Bosea sp. Root381]